MAKVKLDYMSLSMRAEGSDDMVRELSGRFLDMADKYAAPGFYFPALPPSVFEDGCRDPEELNTGDMKPLTTPKEVAPGADWDVVAIYDDAGIPSIMHRFRRMSNKELFGGSDKPHPAFIIGGEVYKTSFEVNKPPCAASAGRLLYVVRGGWMRDQPPQAGPNPVRT